MCRFPSPLLVLLLALSLLFSVRVSADDKASKDAKPATRKATITDASADKKDNFYAVPKGNVKELLQFIHRIQTFRATTVEELLAQRQNKPTAIKAAAKRILKITEESGTDSKAARTALGILLGLKIEELAKVQPGQQPASQQEVVLKEVQQHLAALDQLTPDDLVLALKAAACVKQTGNAKLAVKAYDTFGRMFADQLDETLAVYGREMIAAARQMNLPGNKIEITGMTLDGDRFDWAAYRGKVVLVDFWATWCPRCVAELPSVKRHYQEYHERGFDVVGISLDRDPVRLASFVEQRELPWVTLFEPDASGDHPVAAYYGIREIPTAILVNQDGKVVSLSAHGAQLGHQLEQLLGAGDGSSGDE